MANQRGSGLGITPFDPTPPVDRSVPGSVAGFTDRSSEAAAAVFGGLGAKVGALADQLAASEGRKAGLAAGADPNFRPSDGETIRARAYDKAAGDVYLSNLTARFHADALDLAEAHKADPVGLKAAYDGLVATYRRDHVFPEVDGLFQADATRLGSSLRRATFNQWEAKTKDQQHAALIEGMATRERDTQRVLALDPHDQVAEDTVKRLRDEDVAAIKAQIASGAITAVQGEKLILDRMQGAEASLAVARASTLPTADQVDAYRAKLKADFVAGKLDGVTDFGDLDGALAKLSKAKRVEMDRAVKGLEGDLSDFLDRQKSGLDGSADWAALEARAKAIGPAAIAAVALTRDKLTIRRRIDSLAPDQSGLFVRNIETATKAAPIVTPGAFATGYSPQAMGDRIEGGYESSVAGPDGRAVVRTLEDVREGRSAYVTLAGDPSLYGREYTLPSVTWTANGVTHTLTNVRGVVHDTGSAFRGQPEGRFDVAIGRDLDQTERNQSMRSVRFVPGSAIGFNAHTAELIADARKYDDDRSKLIAKDPLLAATRAGLMPEIAPVDFAAGPDALAAEFRTRVAQADAVAGIYRRPAAYIRPDEKPVLQARLDQGGRAAIDTVVGLVRGAGTRAPQVLAEIGDGAPELAHAAQVQIATGDPSFALEVAEAQKMRAVKGAEMPEIRKADFLDAWRATVGSALQGLDGTEEARTQAAATAWAQREIIRRGLKANDASAMQSLFAEAIQKARGRTGSGRDLFGGLAPVAYGPPGWIAARGSTAIVQVPTNVRADRFGDVLGALTDDDLKALPDPPMGPKGALSASDLRRLAPVSGPGGYRFVSIDAATGLQTPVAGVSGRPFVLPWADVAPLLRARVPDAFR